MQRIVFKSKDGLKLVGLWHLPKKSTNQAIILAHGITVDKDEDGIFISLAKLLESKGFAVFRFDFRAHGESEGEPIELSIKGEVEDLSAAVEEVEKKGYSSIGLLGASFGGGASALYAEKNQDKLRCLCLWNPCLNYDHCFLNPTLPWIKERKGHMKKDFAEKGWSTIGSRKYVVGKKLFDEMETLFPYKELRKIKIPTIVVHGTKDTYVPYEDSKEYIKNVGKLITIKNAGHGFHEPPFNEKAIEATLSFFIKNLK